MGSMVDGPSLRFIACDVCRGGLSELSRLIRWLITAALILASVSYLFMASDSSIEGSQFFGRWRTRNILIGITGLGSGLFVAASPGLRLQLVRWGVLTGVAIVMIEVIGLLGIVSYTDLMNPPRTEFGGQRIPYMDERGSTYQNLARPWGFPSEPIEYHFKTDRRGFRNRVDRVEADLYAVGDSILMYGLIPIDETLAVRMEESLGRPTMNIALIAIGAQEARDIFLEADLPLKDRLVLQFISEDTELGDSQVYRFEQQMGPEGSRVSFTKQTFTDNLVRFLQKKSTTTRASNQNSFGRIDGTNYLISRLRDSWANKEGEYEHVTSALLDMRKVVEQGGGQYAIVLAPAKIRVLGPFLEWPAKSSLTGYKEHLNPFREWLIEWSGEQGIPIQDLTAVLQESTRAGKPSYLPGDTHPNGLGHAIMAKTLAEWDVVREWNERTAPNGN